LSVVPFAVGSAVASVIAGRLVGRHGSRVTVTGLVLVVAGFVALAVITPMVSGTSVQLWILGPLVVAGVGSGAISPTITLALEDVPTEMGGAAGGALQTGQRIGSAVGAALLAAAYRLTLGMSDSGAATAVTFVVSALLAAAALLLAARDLRARRRPG
jgi:MFS family permease